MAELGAIEKIGPGHYHVLAPTRSNATSGYVSVYAFPEVGVCRIVAIAPAVQSDTAGARVEASWMTSPARWPRNMARTRIRRSCAGDETVCTDLWTSQLNNRQASYYYYWDLSSSARADGVYSIELDANPRDSITVQPMIYYNGKNDGGSYGEDKSSASVVPSGQERRLSVAADRIRRRPSPAVVTVRNCVAWLLPKEAQFRTVTTAGDGRRRIGSAATLRRRSFLLKGRRSALLLSSPYDHGRSCRCNLGSAPPRVVESRGFQQSSSML